MAVWKIKLKTGTSGSGTQLKDCKIIETLNPSTGVYTYMLVAPGNTTGPSTSTNPMHFKKVAFAGQTWSGISSGVTPDVNAPPGTQWSGTCSTPLSLHQDEPGTWAAEATGGTGGGKGASKKSTKSASKKSAKGVKSASKKGTKSTKGTKGTKSAKGGRSTKSAKKTRGRA